MKGAEHIMWLVFIHLFLGTHAYVVDTNPGNCIGKDNQYLQPDEQMLYNNCTRECVPGVNFICYYKWTVDYYKTLSQACGNCTTNSSDCFQTDCVSADGYERAILVANRDLAGPPIQVCLGDRIIVDVIMKAFGQATTLHWHGLWQHGTPYNDGVPMVTQCPIPEKTRFVYNFCANNPGTFFWHSHDGVQKVDGLQGPLIVRRAKDPSAPYYDEDLPSHVMFLQDYYHDLALDHYPGLRTHDASQNTPYLLINGLGKYMENGTLTTTPCAKFTVSKGKRYRFRLPVALCQCPATLCIEGHRLLVIAIDGVAIKPVLVDCITVNTGERYDFVLNATNDVKVYRIKVTAASDCIPTGAIQFALLVYEGADVNDQQDCFPSNVTLESSGVVLNPDNQTQTSQTVTLDQLETAEKLTEDKLLSLPAEIIIPIIFAYYFPTLSQLFAKNEYHSYVDPLGSPLYFTINNISQQEPASPILSQRKDIPPDAFCSMGSNGVSQCNNTTSPCDCFNIIKVPLYSRVYFILIDKSDSGGINHAFHLHGYVFNVIAIGQTIPGGVTFDNIKKRLQLGLLKGSTAPIFKDTIAVPSAGFAVIAIVADNPGYWFFHCHILSHHLLGMSVVLQVGNPSDIPPVPNGYPKCVNFPNGHK